MQQMASEDLAAIWQRVHDELESSLPSTFELWVEPLQAIAARGTTLYVRRRRRSALGSIAATALAAAALRDCTRAARRRISDAADDRGVGARATTPRRASTAS